MLTFFRRIRKGLLVDGATSKYLVYAIGEIALVVMGILIALQINNWNEQNKANGFELKMLKELNSSLMTNTQELERGIEMSILARESCLVVLNHLTNHLPYHDSLNVHFSKSLFWYQNIPDYAAFETTKSYGLHLLKNDELRILLSAVYGKRMEWLATVENRNHDFHFITVVPMAMKLFKSLQEWSEMKPVDYSSLKNNTNYISILKTLEFNRDRDVYWFEELLEDMKDLESLVKLEMEKRLSGQI